MAALQRFAGGALVELLGAVVLLSGVGLVVASGWGLAGAVPVAIVVPALRVAVMIASGPPGVVWPSRLTVDAELRPRIVRFCLGIFAVTGFDTVLFQRGEFVLVSRYSGPTEVALFGLAFGLSSVPIAVGPAVSWSVLAPYIAGRWGAGGREAVASAYREVARYAVMLALPACIGAAAIAGSLVQVLYGRQYQGVAPALQLLLVGAAVGALVTSQSAVYLVIGRPGVRSLWGYPTAALDFVLTAALAPGYGATGAAMAKSTAQACMVAFDVSYLRQKHLASPQWAPHYASLRHAAQWSWRRTWCPSYCPVPAGCSRR
jgi:O-antigen/teichoic acid export membrane protein